MIRNDMRAKPIKRMVVMGESNAYGMCAGNADNEWVKVLADSIRDSQDEPLKVYNNSLPSNVISPDALGFADDYNNLAGISALGRFENDMIAYRPDLVVYAYGLNDSRCGHKLESFMKAYRTIITKTKEALPEALIVLVSPYWNLQYDAKTWDDESNAELRKSYGLFGKGGDELVLSYVQAISELASEFGAIFADVYHGLEGAAWLLHNDGCHFNDIGQRIIGLSVFCKIAVSCSMLAQKSKRMEEELDLNVCNTGGTYCLPYVINGWRLMEYWKK